MNELSHLMERLNMLHKRMDDLPEEETEDTILIRQDTFGSIEDIENELKEKYPNECNFVFQN
jgi:translation initiation factor IF-2